MDHSTGVSTQAQRGIPKQGDGKCAGDSQARQVLEASGLLGGIDILGVPQRMDGDRFSSYSWPAAETKMTF